MKDTLLGTESNRDEYGIGLAPDTEFKRLKQEAEGGIHRKKSTRGNDQSKEN